MQIINIFIYIGAEGRVDKADIDEYIRIYRCWRKGRDGRYR